MAKAVLTQAQLVMDDFFQSFRPATAFYDLEDFAYRIIDERDNLLEAEFLVQFNRNKNSFPIVSPSWLTREAVDVKKDEQGRFYADVCASLFEFPEDIFGSGIQNVVPFGSECAEFVRITNHQTWQVCLSVSSSVNLYAVEKCRIWLYNFFGCTDKLEIRLVPSQAGLSLENQTVPDGKAADIREIVLNKAFRDMQARLNRISTHNDGNPNSNPNETSMVYDNLKTK